MPFVMNKVDLKKANEIIEKRTPFGMFWLKEKGVFIGIDNSTGDAWVEDFKTKKSMERWFDGRPAKSAAGDWLNV